MFKFYIHIRTLSSPPFLQDLISTFTDSDSAENVSSQVSLFDGHDDTETLSIFKILKRHVVAF